MNGVIYIDPHTMHGSLTEETDGLMPYVPVSTVTAKDRTIDYAADMLSGFAEKGICDQIEAKKYRGLFMVSMLVILVLVLNFTLGGGKAWISILTCVLWTLTNAAIVFDCQYRQWTVRQVRGDKKQKAETLATLRRALEERKEKPFEE